MLGLNVDVRKETFWCYSNIEEKEEIVFCVGINVDVRKETFWCYSNIEEKEETFFARSKR